jgi:ParB/RepB/Spo0J family partition protein
MTTATDKIQTANVAAEVNSGNEQAASAKAQDSRSTDTSSEAVQSGNKESATEVEAFRPNPSVVKNVDKMMKEKKGYTIRVFKYQETKSPVVIPFHKLVISKWNPSATGTRQEEAIENLKKDIQSHGLINPISIVKTGKDGNGESQFAVIAGAGRLAALKKLRGESAGLMEGEYKILSKLDEDNEKCSSLSLAENAKRSNHSHLTMAKYMCWLVKEQNITESKLAKDTNMRRDGVNRLVKLGEHVAKLPENWVKDLDYTAPVSGKKVKKNEMPRITFAHWETVAGIVGQKGEEPTVQKLLTDTYEGKWKVTKLRKEITVRFPELKSEKKGRPGFGKKAGKDAAEEAAQEQDASTAEAPSVGPEQAGAETVQALSDDELELIRQHRASKKAA